MANKRPPNAEATQFKSGEQAVENGRKGGKASVQSKKNKKLLRECLEELLNKEITDRSGNKASGAEALAAKLFQQALQGNIKAFEVVRDTAGQKPAEKVVVSNIDPDVIAQVERMVNDDL